MRLKERDGGCDLLRGECRLSGRGAQLGGQPAVKTGIALGHVPEGGAERVGDDAHDVWCVVPYQRAP